MIAAPERRATYPTRGQVTHFKEFIGQIYWRDISLQEYRDLTDEEFARYRYVPGYGRGKVCPRRDRKGNLIPSS